MKDRIREIRESMLDENGKKLQKWEIGAAVPNSSAIALIAQKCGISETWLRTGVGEMRAPKGRAEEMAELVKRLMSDRPDSFRSALITTLLRLDPDGPEWGVLETIYRRIADEQKKNQEQ